MIILTENLAVLAEQLTRPRKNVRLKWLQIVMKTSFPGIHLFPGNQLPYLEKF